MFVCIHVYISVSRWPVCVRILDLVDEHGFLAFTCILNWNSWHRRIEFCHYCLRVASEEISINPSSIIVGWVCLVVWLFIFWLIDGQWSAWPISSSADFHFSIDSFRHWQERLQEFLQDLVENEVTRRSRLLLEFLVGKPSHTIWQTIWVTKCWMFVYSFACLHFCFDACCRWADRH